MSLRLTSFDALTQPQPALDSNPPATLTAKSPAIVEQPDANRVLNINDLPNRPNQIIVLSDQEARQNRLEPYPMQPLYNQQVKYERDLYIPKDIKLPEYIPFPIQGVINYRVEPKQYFQTGVADPDKLTPKPFSTAEATEFASIGRQIKSDYAVLRDTDRNLSEKRHARDRIVANKEKFFTLLPRARMAGDDAPMNGQVHRVASDARNWNKPEIIYVNGINTDVARSTIQAWELSSASGSPVRHIVNVSDPIIAGKIGTSLAKKNWNNLEGAQEVNVKELLANPKAANALANVVYEKMRDGSTDPIIVVAYSQGGAITARGLEYVVAQLDRDVKTGKIDNDKRSRQLNRVQVVGMASAAAHRDFPAEIRDRVHIVYDRNDAIPKGRNYTGSTNYFDVAQALGGYDKASYDTFNLTHASYFWSGRFTKPAPSNPAAMLQVRDWIGEIRAGRNPHDKLVELDITDPKFRKSDTPYLP